MPAVEENVEDCPVGVSDFFTVSGILLCVQVATCDCENQDSAVVGLTATTPRH